MENKKDFFLNVLIYGVAGFLAMMLYRRDFYWAIIGIQFYGSLILLASMYWDCSLTKAAKKLSNIVDNPVDNIKHWIHGRRVPFTKYCFFLPAFLMRNKHLPDGRWGFIECIDTDGEEL